MPSCDEPYVMAVSQPCMIQLPFYNQTMTNDGKLECSIIIDPGIQGYCDGLVLTLIFKIYAYEEASGNVPKWLLCEIMEHQEDHGKCR